MKFCDTLQKFLDDNPPYKVKWKDRRQYEDMLRQMTINYLEGHENDATALYYLKTYLGG